MFGSWRFFISAFFLFFFSKSNLGTTKTNTMRRRELLKGDRVEYITLWGVRIEMAHSINALQTLLESTWLELLTEDGCSWTWEPYIDFCSSRLCFGFIRFLFFKKEDSQPYNSAHITNQSYSCRRDLESRWQVFKWQND